MRGKRLRRNLQRIRMKKSRNTILERSSARSVSCGDIPGISDIFTPTLRLRPWHRERAFRSLQRSPKIPWNNLSLPGRRSILWPQDAKEERNDAVGRCTERGWFLPFLRPELRRCHRHLTVRQRAVHLMRSLEDRSAQRRADPDIIADCRVSLQAPIILRSRVLLLRRPSWQGQLRHFQGKR